MFEGRVLKSTGSWFEVELPHQKTISCRIRGQIRLKGISSTNPVAVGDIVHVQEQTDGTGVITDINERTNYIIRKSINLSKQTHILAANIDCAWIVVTPVFPKTSTGFIDRFIAAAESYHIPVGIIFNKSDLFVNHLSEIQHEYLDIYESLGYKCIKVSSHTKEGIDELQVLLDGKVNLLTGHSGVGKSSLINCLIPEINQRVGDVSGKLQKGRHTTRHVELFALPNRGLLADSPGFNQPDINCLPEQLTFYFPEVRQRLALGNCQFNDCTHRREPNCVVRGDWERYQHYLEFLEEAIAREQSLQKTSTKESSLKLKIKEAGQETYEPKLANKKYRRPSRRGKNQDQERYENKTLQDIYNDDSE